MVTAEIALVIDIKGVCNSWGTLDIKRYPIKKDKKNTNSIIISSVIFTQPPVPLEQTLFSNYSQISHSLEGAFENDFSLISNKGLFYDIIIQIKRVQSFLEKIFNVIVHVICIKPA